MINGTVSADREAVIPVIIRDMHGTQHRRRAVIDTGFTGYLTLQPDFITALQLRWKEARPAILADGSEVLCDVYDATVIWDEHVITIPIHECDGESLVGMSLMYGYELNVQNVDGGAVTLKPL